MPFKAASAVVLLGALSIAIKYVMDFFNKKRRREPFRGPRHPRSRFTRVRQ